MRVLGKDLGDKSLLGVSQIFHGKGEEGK
jgi:hypothetical protein